MYTYVLFFSSISLYFLLLQAILGSLFRYRVSLSRVAISSFWSSGFEIPALDGRHPTTSSRLLRVPVLISRADIESVYYVAGDRSGDRSLGKVAGYFCSRWTWEWFWDKSSGKGEGEERIGRRWKKRETGHLDASPRASLLDARACGRADHTYTRVQSSRLWVPTRALTMQHTCRPCMGRSCSL